MLTAGDNGALRTRRFQVEFVRQRLWHDAQCSASVDQKLDLFDISGWAGQLTFDMEKPHLRYPSRLHGHFIAVAGWRKG